MAPFQVIFVRNVRQLYTRGAKKEEFAAIDRYFRSPNPQALLIFVADILRIPSDPRRMEMDDKNRFERMRETLGEHCGIVELARVDEEDAMRWAGGHRAGSRRSHGPDAARELVDALGADMMLIASRTGKAAALHAGPSGRITLGDVETMVLAAKQRSLYELTDAISCPRPLRALALLHGLLNSSDAGEDAAIGHLYMLARTFRQMLVILEKNVRDSRAIWQALWQGFRMPPFAADDLIRQARRYKSRRELDPRVAPDCPRRPGTALFAAGQAARSGAARDGFGQRAEARKRQCQHASDSTEYLRMVELDAGQILSYLEMCQREGMSLQHGMNFRGNDSVFLMSMRKGAPYEDFFDRDSSVLIYEGHDIARKKDAPDPKSVDQPMFVGQHTPSRNKRFFDAACDFKSGVRDRPLTIRVYEKLRAGIWVYNGMFELEDAFFGKAEPTASRQVFRFKLRLSPQQMMGSGKAEELSQTRLIPSEVKLEVYKRDKGQCVICHSRNNLHFDHDFPFSLGGSSLVAANVRLLCARHNLAKGSKIV